VLLSLEEAATPATAKPQVAPFENRLRRRKRNRPLRQHRGRRLRNPRRQKASAPQDTNSARRGDGPRSGPRRPDARKRRENGHPREPGRAAVGAAARISAAGRRSGRVGFRRGPCRARRSCRKTVWRGELGVELSRVRGDRARRANPPRGRDRRRAPMPTSSAPAHGFAGARKIATIGGPIRREAMPKIRKTIAANMVRFGFHDPAPHQLRRRRHHRAGAEFAKEASADYAGSNAKLNIARVRDEGRRPWRSSSIRCSTPRSTWKAARSFTRTT